jgi:hypothetical protein
MPALNFKKQFAPMVESGEKKQTIRACRKDYRDPKPGQTLYLYTGMRTKQCRKLGEATCKSSDLITIGFAYIAVSGKLLSCNKLLFCNEMIDLALADGFSSVQDFRQFFINNHGLPFTGYLIKW